MDDPARLRQSVRQLLNLDVDILLFDDGRRSSTTPSCNCRSSSLLFRGRKASHRQQLIRTANCSAMHCLGEGTVPEPERAPQPMTNRGAIIKATDRSAPGYSPL
jgi:hypothetical protein